MNNSAEMPSAGKQQFLHSAFAFAAQFEKTLLTIGGLICFALFWASGRLFRIPVTPHLSASLLQQPTLASTLVIAAIVYAVSVLIGTIICGKVGFDAGLFCASIGLLALSARGGSMRFTLFSATGSGIWISLAIEISVLAVFVVGGWMIQRSLSLGGLMASDRERNQMLEVHDAIDQKLLAFATNVVVIAALMMILSASDRKMQAVCAVASSSFIATVLAYYLVPTEPSAWYWAAPIAVGAIGYLFQYFGNTNGWRIGEPQGTFAALARPLPLDYVGSGVAFSIFGYWSARKWHRENANTAHPESVN
ncbi:MAG TPA: hypothetical protein VHS31_17105 [Tepidisphaeraceae bacterium]|jgi:hypothetical protein|nr:hypothetical protein [Tepidisphaeraceae bacterium]